MGVRDVSEKELSGRNPADIAWFLATGNIDGVPCWDSMKNLRDLQNAYLCNYAGILEHLLKSTFDNRKKGHCKDRIKDFTRESLYFAFKNSNVWIDIHPEVHQWLEQTLQPPQKYSFKEAWKRNIKSINDKITARVRRAQSAADNSRLYSPAIYGDKAELFYLDRKKEIKFTKDKKENMRSVLRKAQRIRERIEDTLAGKSPDTVNYLVGPNKRAPSVRTIARKLLNTF